MRNSSRLLLCNVLLVAGAAVASAADVCVSCTGPAATYACSVKNGDAIEGLAGDKALRKICTKVLKLTEKHASCQALDVPDGKCAGTPRTVSWGDVKKAVAARESESAVAEPPKTQPAVKANNPPPDKAVSAVQAPAGAPPSRPTPQPSEPTQPSSVPAQPEPSAPQGLGDKIKDAAQSTWTCMASLFGNC